MSCLVLQSATQYYDYTNANCTVGSVVPNGAYTRDTYLLLDGQWLLSSRTLSQTVTNSNQVVLSSVPSPDSSLHYRDVLLPATLLVLALFALIYKAFVGVRR